METARTDAWRRDKCWRYDGLRSKISPSILWNPAFRRIWWVWILGDPSVGSISEFIFQIKRRELSLSSMTNLFLSNVFKFLAFLWDSYFIITLLNITLRPIYQISMPSLATPTHCFWVYSLNSQCVGVAIEGMDICIRAIYYHSGSIIKFCLLLV